MTTFIYQSIFQAINSHIIRRITWAMTAVLTGLMFLPFSLSAENIPLHTQTLLDQAPDKTKQAIVVFTPHKEQYGAELSCFERNNDHWRQYFPPVPALIGYAGLAEPEEKREGDGKTPPGMYALRFSFGQKVTPPGKMPYRLMRSDDFWIDDPSSPAYNTLQSGDIGSVSAERMKLSDGRYDLGLLIEYNTNPVIPGFGSAIFIHIWKNPQEATHGCVALEGKNLERIMAWLDPEKNPVIIIFGADTENH